MPVNPQLVALINGFIKGAQSDAVGRRRAPCSLVVIVLFLFKSIEDAFNDIWGVRRGRSILMRVVLYWTVLTLGGVVFFAAVALLGAGAFVNVFVGRLPFGAEIVRLLRWSLPSFSFVLLVGRAGVVLPGDTQHPRQVGRGARRARPRSRAPAHGEQLPRSSSTSGACS